LGGQSRSADNRDEAICHAIRDLKAKSWKDRWVKTVKVAEFKAASYALEKERDSESREKKKDLGGI